jgi:thiol-disulfide isomerase/thioredoxin
MHSELRARAARVGVALARGVGFWSCLSLLALGSLGDGCAREGGQASKALPALPTPTLIGQIRAATSAGYAALGADSLDRALEHFRRLSMLVPETPRADYHIACAYARAGQPEEGLQALRRAIEKGYSDLAGAAADPDLETLRARDEWAALAEDMRQLERRGRIALERAYRELSPDSEPAFPTLDSLETHYDDLQRRAQSAGLIYSDLVAAQLRCDALNHRIAGLERYRREHDATERYAILMSRLRAQSLLPEIDDRPWTLGRSALLATADEILSQYPDSAGAADAALWKVRADWYGGLRGEVREVAPVTCDAIVARLREVAAQYPGKPGGCDALIEAVLIVADNSEDDLERIRPVLADLESRCGINPRAYPESGYRINELALRVNGAPDFSATDIDGRAWSLTQLRGQYVLLDFWATWCGPCRAEIPRLVELSKRYPPERLRILGVSLDRGPSVAPEALRTWSTEHGMTWPQIYDGAAWDGALVTQYRIPAIPFPVLIAPNGAVLAAGEGARGDALGRTLAAVLGS